MAVKGMSYAPGTHWTQRPENKEKLRAQNRGRRRGPNKIKDRTDKGLTTASIRAKISAGRKAAWARKKREESISTAVREIPKHTYNRRPVEPVKDDMSILLNGLDPFGQGFLMGYQMGQARAGK